MSPTRVGCLDIPAVHIPRPGPGEHLLAPTTKDEDRVKNKLSSKGDKHSSIARIQVSINAVGVACQKLCSPSRHRVSHGQGLGGSPTRRRVSPEFAPPTAGGRRRSDSEATEAVIDD